MEDSFVDFQDRIDYYCRNLPHMHQEGKYQFVTFHLYDSIPKDAINELQKQRSEWIKNHPTPYSYKETIEYRKLFNNKTEEWLDNGYGSCILADRKIARIVADSMHFNDKKHYCLIAYVVMSNHVHVLLETFTMPLANITFAWKSYTSHAISKALGCKGRIWHKESWDRLIRNQEHFNNVIRYINKNISQGGILWYFAHTP